jgi:group I intron endonuclease
MAFIYVITNDINGKQYVGKTNFSLERRFREHISDSKKERCNKRPLYSAMNKYGIEHFHIEQLEECSAEGAAEREEYWIAKLNTYGHTGYNATKGGDGTSYYNYKEVAEKYLELGTVHSVCEFYHCDAKTVRVACKEYNVKIATQAEQSRNKLSKPIIMIDKETNEPLKIFPSCSDAGRWCGDRRKSQHIVQVCVGVRNTAYGYKWAWLKDYQQEI